jgi:hypothetical protein
LSVKQNSTDGPEGGPAEVFRQFAWHLAGSLATAGAKSGTGRSAGKPAKGQVKR